MLLFYNISIRLYFIAIRLASLWNKKAASWVNGRKVLFEKLAKNLDGEERVIWMHCSSAGEFEQGKPLIEALKSNYPTYKVLVSFFSPSGLETVKSSEYADYLSYLPLDTRANAERFVKLVRPEIVIFIKYEFWYHHLSTVCFHHIPLILVSAVFRKEQIFFRRHGKFFRNVLFLFRHICVQDKGSLELLQRHGISHCSISGDTRFDRVKEIGEDFTDIAFIQNFIGNKKVIVAGSTWKGDEALLSAYAQNNPGVKIILAPHEINKQHISSLKNLFPDHVLYSGFTDKTETSASVLIIDSVGLLSRLYRYATISYVGGGFTKDGIHNILEAAVWGKAVIFGPNYKKYREAGELIEAGGGFSVPNAAEFKNLAGQLLNNEQHLQAASLKAKNYVLANTGATKRIIQVIQEKRLLTN